MHIGVVLPQTEIGDASVADLRRYTTEVEALGFTHILAYDHVLGADPEQHAPWSGPYDVHTTFHEPFVLFGFLAACTSIELVTGVIILPQRQTALVAKQAAEVALLTEGRFRLGVGIGWNAVEYEALGMPFAHRGRRMSEQIPLMRRLLSEPVVTHAGEFDRVTAAGLAPLPPSDPSRSGSAVSPSRPTGAPAVLPTDGSPRSPQVPRWTRLVASSRQPPPMPGATPPISAWRVG